MNAQPSASDSAIQKICDLLGLEDSYKPKVAKYLRCNGTETTLQAAAETRSASKSISIDDPWAYCIQVDNERWWRNHQLYLHLALYEHSLRSHVNTLMTTYLGRAHWWDPLQDCIGSDHAAWLVCHNAALAAHKPTDSSPIPPIRQFRRAHAFMEALSLHDLHMIVVYNWHAVFESALLDPNEHRPFEQTWRDSAFESIEVTRNDVMHCRFVPKSAFSKKLTRIRTWLIAMEWDIDKAIGGIKHVESSEHDGLI
ncbi:MAG TPA: hypothetical protein VNF75_02565 [Candidatus Dormibacteraeota bacterium]|nr:hypothetical protein [Candidatus Dormibacteraeota bacterium]